MKCLRLSRRSLLAGAFYGVALAGAPLTFGAPSTARANARTPLGPDALQVFNRALEAYRSGDLETGDRAAQAVSDPIARLTLRWAAIRLNSSENLGTERIMAFLRDAPQWPTRSFIRRKAEAAFLGSNPGMAAVLNFFNGQPPQTQGGRLTYALALLQSGKTVEAQSLAQTLWREEPLTQAQRNTMRETFAPALRPADHMARIDFLLVEGDRDGALKTAEFLGAGHVRWVRARIAAASGAKDAGKLLAEVPDALRRTPGYRLAHAQILRDRPEEAARALAARGDEAEGPLGDLMATERRIIATRLIETNRPDLAFAVMANHEADSGSRSADADIFAAFIALRLMNDPQRAIPYLDRVLPSNANASLKARAAYWRGRAAEMMRADPTPFYRRAAESSTHYYGQLAATRLGQRTLRLRTAPEPRDNNTPVIQAIRLLEAVDARDLALPLYIDMARQGADAETLSGLVRIARAHGDARGELTVARIAAQRGFAFEREAFPVLPAADRAFSGEPEEWALAHAITKQESGFDPKAVSSAGARGLMQLLPGTAKETARKLGRSYNLAALTADQGYNLMLGTAYFSELSKQFNGAMILAVASYNAGAGNVRKWIASFGDPRQPGIDPVDWVERIPFGETRTYVQRVIENWQVYRQRQNKVAMLRTEAELKR